MSYFVAANLIAGRRDDVKLNSRATSQRGATSLTDVGNCRLVLLQTPPTNKRWAEYRSARLEKLLPRLE
jgi:hypothetical protein